MKLLWHHKVAFYEVGCKQRAKISYTSLLGNNSANEQLLVLSLQANSCSFFGVYFLTQVAPVVAEPLIRRLFLLHPAYPTVLLELTNTTDTIVTSAGGSCITHQYKTLFGLFSSPVQTPTRLLRRQWVTWKTRRTPPTSPCPPGPCPTRSPALG